MIGDEPKLTHYCIEHENQQAKRASERCDDRIIEHDFLVYVLI